MPKVDIFYSITLKGEEYYSFLDKLTNNEIVKNFYKLVRLIAISDLSRRKKDYKSSFVKNLHLKMSTFGIHRLDWLMVSKRFPWDAKYETVYRCHLYHHGPKKLTSSFT
jgi:hypothetical protein